MEGQDQMQNAIGDDVHLSIAGTSARIHSEEVKMEDIREDLKMFMKWFDALKVTSVALTEPSVLYTGQVFAEVLNYIDPEFFNQEFVANIGALSQDSTILLKDKRIKMIWQYLEKYIMEILTRAIMSGRWTDVSIQGFEESDLLTVYNLSILIVVISHLGPNKDDFLQHSTNMSRQSNFAERFMEVLPEIMSEIPEMLGFDKDFSEQGSTRNSLLWNSNNLSGRDSLNTPSIIGEKQDFEEERKRLENEIARLNRHIETLQSSTSKSNERSPISPNNSDQQIIALQNKIEELKEVKNERELRLDELENELEATRAELKNVAEENNMLNIKILNISPVNEKMQSLQDELNMMKVKLQSVTSDAEKLKPTEKELKDTKLQVKQLGERLDHHVKASSQEDSHKDDNKNLRLELSNLKSDLRIQETKLLAKENMIEKLEIELADRKLTIATLEQRKEELEMERNSIEMKYALAKEEMERAPFRSDGEKSDDDGSCSSNRRAGVSLAWEIERKRLLERIEELEKCELLKGENMVLRNKNSDLEEKLAVSDKEKAHLQQELTKMEQKVDTADQMSRGGVADLRVVLDRVVREKDLLQTKMDKLEKSEKEARIETELLNEAMNKSMTIIERIEKCPVGENGETSVAQFREIQHENDQLRKKVSQLEATLETSKATSEQEVRLVTTAFHAGVHDRNRDAMEMAFRAVEQQQPSLLNIQKLGINFPISFMLCTAGLFVVVWQVLYELISPASA